MKYAHVDAGIGLVANDPWRYDQPTHTRYVALKGHGLNKVKTVKDSRREVTQRNPGYNPASEQY